MNLITKLNNQNRIILITTILTIGIFFTLNFLALINPVDIDSMRYWMLILTYVLMVVTLYLEKDHLADFHIDRYSIVIFISFGTMLHRRLLVPYELIYQIFLYGLSGCMLLYLLKNWNSIPGMNLREFIVSNVILAIFLVFITFLENSLNNVPSLANDKLPIMYILRDLILEFSFIAPMEEFLFRGMLWGILTRLGFTLRKVFIIQGFVFWLLHFRSEDPVILFIILPLCTIFYSYMIVKFRRLFPAILSHALVNAVNAFL